MKKKIKWVYCPKCGEVANASFANCEHCKESLKGAAEIDPGEARVKRRRERSIKRDAGRRARRAKKQALFEKAPILKLLYYLFLICLVFGILAGIVQVFKASELAGFIVLTVVFSLFYMWYAPLLVDSMDSLDKIADRIPAPGRARFRMILQDAMWGLIVNGGIVIIGLLGLIGALIMEMMG